MANSSTDANCSSSSKTTEFTSLSAMITANTLQVKPSCKYLKQRCIANEMEQNLLANAHPAEDPDTGSVCKGTGDNTSDVVQMDIRGDQQILESELPSVPPDTIAIIDAEDDTKKARGAKRRFLICC